MSNPSHVDNIYYNVELSNNSETGELLDVNFSSSQTEAVLQHPDEYFLTVARFSISGLSIPNIYFETEPEQIDPNLGVYTITLQYTPGPNNYTSPITYTPQNNFPVPTFPFNRIDPYFFIYNYQQFLDYFNDALAFNFSNLAGAHVITSTEAPYFIYSEGEIKLIVQNSFIADGIDILMNAPTYSLFNSLKGFINGFNTPDPDLYFRFTPYFLDNAYTRNGATPPDPPIASTLLEFELEYRNFQVFSAMRNLVITTNMPINGELKPQIVSLGITQTGAQSFQKVLTDFTPDITGEGSEREQLIYYPSGQWRLIDVISSSPLRDINLQVFWSDRNGRLFPVKLAYGQSASVKLLFIKKDRYGEDNDLDTRIEQNNMIRKKNMLLNYGKKEYYY